MAPGFVVLLVWFLLAVAGIMLSTRWIRQAWRQRHGATRTAFVLSLLLGAGTAIGVLGSGVGLAQAFGSMESESGDPSGRARTLAEGISQAMNCTAVGLLLGLPPAIALPLLARRKRPKRAA